MSGIYFKPTAVSKGGFVTDVEAVYPEGFEGMAPEQQDWEEGL